MRYVAGDDRHQSMLLPAHIDDYVEVDAAVRVIDALRWQSDLDRRIACHFSNLDEADTTETDDCPDATAKLLCGLQSRKSDSTHWQPGSMSRDAAK